MSRLEHKIIALCEVVRKHDPGNTTEDNERFHALKARFSQSQYFLIDSGTSNHMVSSKDLFSSLSVKEGPTIHMGDDSQIPVAGKGTIIAKHGVFIDVLYVPSRATNLLFVYQMTYTGFPKQVLFGPDSVEITNISTREIVVKGTADHASKAYYFSHFIPFSVPTSSQLPFKDDEGIKIPSLPIAVSVLNPDISDSDSEEESSYFDPDIDIKTQRDLDPDPTA